MNFTSRLHIALAAMPLAFLFCGVVQAQQLNIEELWTTEGDPPFVVISGMAEAEDGSIWVSDGRVGVVYGLDAQGGAKGGLVPNGNGPGEVRNPHQLHTTPDGQIAVYDLGRRAIDVFSSQGRFERRVQLEAAVVNPKGFVVSRQGEYFLSGGIIGKENSIFVFGEDGKLNREWFEAPKTQNPRAGSLTSGGALHITNEGNLLFSLSAPHNIALYSLEGRLLREIASDEDLLTALGDDFIQERGAGSSFTRTFQWGYSQSVGVFQMSDGKILNVVRLQNNGGSLWELYSPSGDLIDRLEIDRSYRVWSFTKSGDLLASYVDNETGQHLATRLKLEVQ